MNAFLIYIITAIGTGWQLSQQILMGVWGKPSNPIEYLAFAGSMILLVSAYVALFSLSRARSIAIVASALLWMFYVPASINAITGIVSGGHSLVPLAFIPILLLVITTGYSVLTAFRVRRQKASDVTVHDAPPKKFRRIIIVFTGLTILAVVFISVFLVGVEREVAAPVDCTIEHEGDRAIAKMTFQKLEGFQYIETDSGEVLAYLRTNDLRNVIVRVSLTYDFGKARALNLNYAYLGNIKFRPYVERKP